MLTLLFSVSREFGRVVKALCLGFHHGYTNPQCASHAQVRSLQLACTLLFFFCGVCGPRHLLVTKTVICHCFLSNVAYGHIPDEDVMQETKLLISTTQRPQLNTLCQSSRPWPPLKSYPLLNPWSPLETFAFNAVHNAIFKTYGLLTPWCPAASPLKEVIRHATLVSHHCHPSLPAETCGSSAN
jgi:hypothetical protein